MNIRLTKLELIQKLEANPVKDYLGIKLVLDKDKAGFHIHFEYGTSIFKEILYHPALENNIETHTFQLMKMAFNAGIKQGKKEKKEEIQKAIGANIITKFDSMHFKQCQWCDEKDELLNKD